MLELNTEESLSLYFFLSDREDLSETLNSLLIKIEAELFNRYTVKELETLRLKFKDKGIF